MGQENQELVDDLFEEVEQLANVIDDMEADAIKNAPEGSGLAKYETDPSYLDDIDDNLADDLVADGEEDAAIYVRTSTLLPMEKLETEQVRIIGIGGIGRQVGLQVAAAGVRSVVLFDDDAVTKTNVSTQGYPYNDVGAYKVSSLLYHMNEMTPCGQFLGYEATFPLGKVYEIEQEDRQTGAAFLCVDKIEERAKIFKALRKCPILIDGRMAAETGRIVTILFDDEDDRAYYESTLFKQEEQEPDRCTEKATIYCGNFIAAIMVAQYMRWIRGLIKPGDRYLDMMFSLKAFDLFPYKQPLREELEGKKAPSKAKSKGGASNKKKRSKK